MDEAARLWTAFMVAVMTLVGYMNISVCRVQDLHNHDSMIFQHSTFIHSEITYFFILKSETIIIAMISQCQTYPTWADQN